MSEFDLEEPEPRETPPEPRQGPKQRPGPNDVPSEPVEPPEPAADEPPDLDDAPEPDWQVFPGHFGPKVDRVLYKGEPLGQVLARDFPSLDSGAVEALLLSLAAPEHVARDYARRRAQRDSANADLEQHPDWASFIAQEAQRGKKMTAVRQAFIDAQKKVNQPKGKNR